MAIETVNFPIIYRRGDFPWLGKCLPEGNESPENANGSILPPQKKEKIDPKPNCAFVLDLRSLELSRSQTVSNIKGHRSLWLDHALPNPHLSKWFGTYAKEKPWKTLLFIFSTIESGFLTRSLDGFGTFGTWKLREVMRVRGLLRVFTIV